MSDTGITLTALLYKISTTQDGGYRVQFDTGQDSKEAIKALMDHQSDLLQLAVVVIDQGARPQDG